MTPFNHSDRLRRFSKAMAMLTTLGIVLIAVAMVLVFLIPDWTRNLLLARLGQAGHDLSLSPGRLIAGAAITAVPVGVLLFGLWQVRALFLNFANGHVFTLASARLLRDFAGSVLAQAILGPLSATALSIAFTLNNPPGSRQLVEIVADGAPAGASMPGPGRPGTERCGVTSRRIRRAPHR